MAQFTGTGQLTLNGVDSRFYDFECSNSGGFTMASTRQRLENCYMLVDVTVANNAQQCIIRGNTIWAEVILAGNNDHTVIVGNYLDPQSGGG